MNKFWSQTKANFMIGAKNEWRNKERILSPILFALVIILMFGFAIGDMDPELRQPVYVAQVFIAIFFALQIAFSRIFEPDTQDSVFEIIRTYPIDAKAYFFGKYLLVLCLGTLIILPTLGIANVFLKNNLIVGPFLIFQIFITLIGLASLGVLISALTLKASTKQILFPILYFPLCTPALLAGVQSTLVYLEKGTFNDVVTGWIGLTLIFDVIYLTLGLMLFPELMDEK